LLVNIAALLLTIAVAQRAEAQARPFEIADNSFLVEEAFNQEPGIFQNIFNIRVGEDGNWEATFTQEWPVFTQTHQFSYTMPYLSVEGRSGLGDVFLNYRWQALTEAEGRPAFSPRLSLILPTNSVADSTAGWQVNLPVSKQFRDAYVHANVGFTHTPTFETSAGDVSLLVPHLAGSVIFRVLPMFHAMVEQVVSWPDADGGEGAATVYTFSPGFRTGWNSGDAQTIFGFAVPLSFADGESNVGVFGYFSYELPFIRRP
jgi:hypothetical protein